MDKKKILVVDDEKECCDFLKDYFTRHNCYVNVAYDGLKAKNLLEVNNYDFIFFDCNMPELTGVELIKVIDKKNPKAKKIMISGYDSINGDFAKDLGIDIFLSKPISVKDIEEVIKDEPR